MSSLKPWARGPIKFAEDRLKTEADFDKRMGLISDDNYVETRTHIGSTE